MSTLIGVVLATLAALGLARNRARAARVADNFFMSPLVLPGITFGLAALVYFSTLGFRPSLNLMIAGHLIVTMPFILRTTTASLSQLDPALLDSSQSLGASWFYTLRRVTLPLIFPGIAAGAFLAFMPRSTTCRCRCSCPTPAPTPCHPHVGMMESTLDVRVAAVSGVLIAAAFVCDADHGMDGGPHPPHARLGSEGMEIQPQPLTQEAFAPFGDVIDVPSEPGRKYYEDALGNLRPSAHPSLSLSLKAETPDRPLKADLLERHEFSSQTFVPIDVARWLIVVAPQRQGGRPRSRGRQGVHRHRQAGRHLQAQHLAPRAHRARQARPLRRLHVARRRQGRRGVRAGRPFFTIRIP